MRILVVVSQILEAEETVRIRDGAVDTSASKLVVDTMDEYGIEQALRLREAGADAEIVAVGVGPAGLEEALRTALGMGVDRAIHVLAVAALDTMATAAILAEVAKEENADLVFTGGQQAASDTQAIGAILAARLDWPQVTWVNQLTCSGQTLSGRHDADAGSETFELTLPAVLTTQQGLNEPRYPTLPNIIKSRRKELRKDSAERFQVAAKVQVLSSALEVRERMHRILDGKDTAAAAQAIVHFLRDEAKVLA